MKIIIHKAEPKEPTQQPTYYLEFQHNDGTVSGYGYSSKENILKYLQENM